VDAMSKMRFEINFLDLLNLILFLVEEIERKKNLIDEKSSAQVELQSIATLSRQGNCPNKVLW
jgi:hypothetical protein